MPCDSVQSKMKKGKKKGHSNKPKRGQRAAKNKASRSAGKY